jgi:AcrR family transcriptional regulator
MPHTPHESGERRREQLVDAALAIIAELGVAGLTTQALSRRVGIVPSAIYRHFRDMGALLDAVVAAIFARLNQLVADAEAQKPPGLACLHAVFLSHLELIRRYPGIPMLIFSREGCGGRPARQAQVLAGIRVYQQRVAAMLQKSIELGEIDRDLEVDAASTLYLGLIQPAALLRMLSDGAWDLDRHAAFVWPLFRAALGAKEIAS